MTGFLQRLRNIRTWRCLAEERLDVGKAAHGLHVAVQKVRNESRSHDGILDPMAWVPYRHVRA